MTSLVVQMVVCFFHALIFLVTQHLKGEPQKAQVLSLLLLLLLSRFSRVRLCATP